MELKVTNLRKQFKDVTAVDGISFAMTSGVYGLLGVNGAGKTTLMRMLTTLIPPTSGSITWDGRDIYAMDGEYRRLVGYLPQEFGFYPDFTVQEYLMYIACLKGLRPGIAKQRVKKLLAQVDLTKARNKKMKALSGGMKRRAGIAQAMLNNPKILILAEPTAGLDPSERIRFRNLISELSQDRIVLLSTHIVSDIEYIAQEIWLMKDGSLVEQGTLEEILASMRDEVWICRAGHAAAKKLSRRYPVSNIKSEGRQVELRVIAPRAPMDNALQANPTLEDVFLSYFGQKGEVSDGTL